MCAQLGPSRCDPMDCSLPGSSVHGISLARILKWVAICFSKGSSDPGMKAVSPASPALQVYALPLRSAINRYSGMTSMKG